MVLEGAHGHAGASGYLAAMALMGVAPDQMKPAALVMNILVASVGTIRFYRAGCFSWPLFLPFAAASIPFAFVGGALSLPAPIYKQVVGVILLVAALRLLLRPSDDGPDSATATKRVPFLPAGLWGAGIGFLSGVTGTGGGIFLTPLLLFTGWAETKKSAGVSVAFILVNSIAGILGHLASMNALPSEIPYWATAAVLGGVIGSDLGSKRLGSRVLQRLLGVVLLVAAAKLLFVS
jgi:hypothetical protein